MSTFSHLDNQGRAAMVDVGDKAITERTAVAETQVTMALETLTAIRELNVKKGDVLTVARVAGIQAAKRCDSLIPLCHSLPLNGVTVDFVEDAELPGLCIRSSVSVSAKTGVEMEALTAVSVAALTVYDMCKSADKGMTIGPTRLLKKEGGRSGTWTVEDDSSQQQGAKDVSDF
ncbi:MAG: cyclic pyranopterin monophosphate synthase MoaC [Pseudomonadota bacterium]